MKKARTARTARAKIEGINRMHGTTSTQSGATALDIAQWANGNLKELGYLALRRVREQPGADEERDLLVVGIALCRARATIRDAVAVVREGTP